VRELFLEFVQWLKQRYWNETDFIDNYFDPDNFGRELAELPGSYSPPSGRLLLAEFNSAPAGCVAFRDLGNKVCEMKRLFVSASCHGNGVGKALVKTLLNEARKEGYRSMRLDTGYKQFEAQRLYRKSGFRIIRPYYDLPEAAKRNLVFMGLQL
jgi:GNAT superfamily N-acetyltransferase